MAKETKEVTTLSDKKPFSELVGDAVDQLNIREYYKGANNRKIALHVKELMKILLTNHGNKIQQSAPMPQETAGLEYKEVQQPGKGLVLASTLDMGLQAMTQEYGVNQFYAVLPTIIMNSPNIAPHDRMLCQTVMSLMITLNFDIHNDIELIADPLTESITTTRVPDWKPLRHHIDKEHVLHDRKSLGFQDREKSSGRLGAEELFHSNLDMIGTELGIDAECRKYKLLRIMKGGENKFSHTPFEYFHKIEELSSNHPDKKIYMLRTYIHTDPSTGRESSIIAFLDKDYNFLNPDFPVIDDSRTDQLHVLVNAFGNLNVGRCAAGFFFKYKDQLILIKNGKYILPAFSDQLAGEKFSHIQQDKNAKGYYIVCTDKHHYLTDSYFRVLGKSVDEVKKKTEQLKK